MYDSDLSQALESPLGSEETGSESCCFDTTNVQEQILRLDVGLHLAVSRNPKTMQGVATLLLAVDRMKKSLTSRGRELSDDELCGAIMDSLMDETIVKTVENFSTGERKITFQRVNSVRECTLCDTTKKDVIYASGELKLQAVTLKGGQGDRKVNFRLSRYITACVSPDDGQSVVLSITNQNLHISCSMNGDKAELNLEECTEEELRKISNDGHMDRFLFYKRTTGISLTTFESVKCRGWFISTSYEQENQPVEMCKVDTAHRLTSFVVNIG
ncbi:interleukin-1 beta [Xiphias gladius]|uniref:interleukin-1 beta n=1 Tax=Xiphias gladius TaxID=8245 RepID=UPI001A98DA55|nr:interleukin-1 beta [Xiphias gladius]